MDRLTLTRRRFVGAMAGSLALGPGLSLGAADDRPPVAQPRATDGDDRAEPEWDERLTVTVGTDGRKCDLAGPDELADNKFEGFAKDVDDLRTNRP
jgi:hypothetical protein